MCSRWEELAERVAAGRPYDSMADLVRRTGMGGGGRWRRWPPRGAFGSSGLERRAALWAAGPVRPGPGPTTAARDGGGGGGATAAGMSPVELGAADPMSDRAVGGQPRCSSPRERLDEARRGLRRRAGRRPARGQGAGRRGGDRRRPATAGETTFINLGRDRPDQRDLLKGVWARYAEVGESAAALLIRGRLERAEGVVNVIADQLRPLPWPLPTPFPGLPLSPGCGSAPGVCPPLQRISGR